MTIDIDLSFPHRFHCEVVGEIPSGAVRQHYFTKNVARGGRDGILVLVESETLPSWIGMFAYGNGSCCRVLTMPNPDHFCVVSKGAGYIVSASMPDTWEVVNAIPVTDVRSIPAAGLVVFANFTELLAYGETGVRWRTKRLAWDGLTIIATGDRTLVGEYWDIRSDATKRFEVDLLTGAACGAVDIP